MISGYSAKKTSIFPCALQVLRIAFPLGNKIKYIQTMSWSIVGIFSLFSLCESLIDYESRERMETDYDPQDTTFN